MVTWMLLNCQEGLEIVSEISSFLFKYQSLILQ